MSGAGSSPRVPASSPSDVTDPASAAATSKRPSWCDNGTFSSTLLIVLVVGTSFASDKWIPNSQLSLPLLIATGVAAVVTAVGIPGLRALKMGQVIREEGPQAHLKKTGTPTMGGLLVVPVGAVVGSLVSSEGEAALRLLSVAGISLAYMLIGGFDDWRSLTKHTNTGLTPRGKLVLQTAAAVLFLAVAASLKPRP